MLNTIHRKYLKENVFKDFFLRDTSEDLFREIATSKIVLDSFGVLLIPSLNPNRSSYLTMATEL